MIKNNKTDEEWYKMVIYMRFLLFLDVMQHWLVVSPIFMGQAVQGECQKQVNALIMNGSVWVVIGSEGQ
jgi:hypothetical protein